MTTLKGPNRHKGRTFGGVAACPHCSCPIRVHLVVARTQAVLDVVAASVLVPPYPAENHVYPCADAASSGTDDLHDTITVRQSGDVGAPVLRQELIAFPGERGYDDDENPIPPAKPAKVDVR